MKKIILVFIIFNFFNLLFAQNSAPTGNVNLDREFFNAEKLFFQKKYNLSREAFLLYLKKRPLSTNDMLYYYIGACYFQDKQYQNAIEYYKLAFDINDSYSYCNNIANSYYQLKNYNEALIWYNRSAERLHSLYSANINEEILTDYTISQNVVTNTIFIGNSDLNSNQNLEENINEDFNNFTNEKNSIYNSFTKLPLFTNIIITNTYTNEYSFTNKTASFEDNDNFYLSIIGDTTNITTITDFTLDGTNMVFTNIIVSFNSYNTSALYYSAYLNMGHTYLALGDLTNAAISYEIFLKNVGDDYYQKDSLDKVISLIRTNDNSIKFIPFTNNYRISENNDGSITTENIYPNFDYTKEILFDNGVRIVYEKGKIEKTKMYSNDYEISDTLYDYGKREIETIFENGDKKTESYFADNSKSINIKTAGGDIFEYILYADGSFINRKSEGDNIITEIKKPDGSLIVKTDNPDGSYKIVANYIDGSIGTTIVDSEGISALKIVYPDGRVEERNSQNTGEGTFSYNIKADDGSVITKTYNDDGSFTVITKKVDGTVITDTVSEDTVSEIKMPNGSLITRIIKADGSKETTTVNKDSSYIKETVNADSSSVTETVNADGSTSTITKDIYGNTEAVNIFSGGGYSVHKNYIDGKSVINETKSDGTIIDIENDGKNKTLRAVDFEGYIIEMKQYVNGDSEIALHDSAGNRVDLKTAKMVIRRMDLSIKAEDVNNLIGAENENSTDENLADENSEVDTEESFNENEEESLNDFEDNSTYE
ncbi:tetratricopeptide repeat protein [Brachyspira sp.]|uniref:tetratricopeptide repeat protein n=1 Tax=Brachyspira sp. TaxID=1977261 RepID=UPI003D7D9EED